MTLHGGWGLPFLPPEEFANKPPWSSKPSCWGPKRAGVYRLDPAVGLTYGFATNRAVCHFILLSCFSACLPSLSSMRMYPFFDLWSVCPCCPVSSVPQHECWSCFRTPPPYAAQQPLCSLQSRCREGFGRGCERCAGMTWAAWVSLSTLWTFGHGKKNSEVWHVHPAPTPTEAKVKKCEKGCCPSQARLPVMCSLPVAVLSPCRSSLACVNGSILM